MWGIKKIVLVKKKVNKYDYHTYIEGWEGGVVKKKNLN